MTMFDDDDDEDYRDSNPNVYDRESGKPRRMAEECATCIFRPGNVMDLQPGRLREMVNGARRNGSTIVCHTSLPAADYGIQAAACRGFLDRYSTNWSRIMERLGGFIDVPDPSATADAITDGTKEG